MSAPAKPILTVQVRELIDFALRSGDLGGDGAFVGRDRALAGTRGHQQVQRSRPAGYQKEVPLVFDLDAGDFILRIQGRIDGLLVGETGVLLEEIKTVQGRWDHRADPLHWAQAKVYGFIYAQDHSLDQIQLRLTYLNLDTGEHTEFVEQCALAALSDFFANATGIYLEWVRDYRRWCRKRDESIANLSFPFVPQRSGQAELVQAVLAAIGGGNRLFVEAPTGIGKTISVLFPAVQALGLGQIERIFYLTARSTGRAAAEKAFRDLRQARLQLRALTLTAKEKLCLRDGQPCDLQMCPLARGYYDRRKPALAAALAHQEINRTVLETVAQQHQVCPFELSLDLSQWVDAVICDYNYLFDPRVYLRRHFTDEPGDYVFLVDEAHNLVDRAREMFSADLDARQIQRVRSALKNSLPRCAKALGKVRLAMQHLNQATAQDQAGSPTAPAPEAELDLFAPPANGGQMIAAMPGPRPPFEAVAASKAVLCSKELPNALVQAVADALQEVEKWLARNEASAFRDDLLELYFRLHAFVRTAERYDERCVTIASARAETAVRLYCLDPSRLLREALNRGQAAVLFSATLTPLEYHRELLGGSSEDPLLQLSSPFPVENLAVIVQDHIRTTFKARAASVPEVVEAISAVIEQRPGNYLVYFPSYQYLAAVQAPFQELHPNLTVLIQRPGMSDSERTAFLASFEVEHRRTLVGFAVLGGIFGEGIDLVGDRLIGAIVVGVGLPQICVERDLIRHYFDEKTGHGFDYAYSIPGMNRVLQATGRVIRSETDRGVVLLIDKRFGELRYRCLFPSWWRTVRVRTPAATRESARLFWETET